MPVESATYISQLDVTKPAGSDAKAEGDDQLRLLKSTVKATFPNFTAAPLNATQAQIDKLVTALAVNASAPAGAIVVDAAGYVYVNGAQSLGITGAFRHQVSGSYLAYGDGNGFRALNSTANGAVSLTAVAGAGGGGRLDSEAGPLLFNTAGVERARIDGSGVLLVGRTASVSGALSRLVVAGNGATYFGVCITNTSTTNTQFLTFTNSSDATAGSVVQNGSTSVLYNTTSDYRLKNNPQPLTGSGEFIDALEPVTWTWVIDGSRGAGFIAHKFQAVSPSSVTGEKDAVDADGKPIYQSMQASSPEVMANIVAELQSLRARVAALEAA